MAAAAKKDYAKIGKANITRPSKSSRLPKFHIYSGHKKGKTDFSMSAGIPNTLIIDPEHGTDPFKTKDPHVWHISGWAEIDDVYNYLRLGDHPYTWFSLDGMTKISNYSLRYVMKLAEDRSLDRQPGIVDRRDYYKANELMKEMLTKFHNLPMGGIFTSHERMIEVEADSEDDVDVEEAAAMFVPDLPKGVRSAVNTLVDVIGRLYVVKVEVGGEERAQRRLWIGESVKYDTGYRSDFAPLPDMIRNPTVPKLVELMSTGKTTTKKKKGKK
jgi:hypothetical protein